MNKLEEKSKIKKSFTAAQIKDKFEKLSDDLDKALGRLSLAVQANEVKERHKTQKVIDGKGN